MIFRLLGKLVRVGWPVFLAAWVLLAVGTHLAAPAWSDVARDREFAFLPADAPSRQADAEFARAFPDDHLGSNVVLVVRRTGEQASADRARAFIADVIRPGILAIAKAEGGLAGEAPAEEGSLFSDTPAAPEKPAKRSIIARVHTPDALGSGALLVSPDDRAFLVVVELTTEFLSADNWPTLTAVEQFVRDLRDRHRIPEGIDVSLTGSAVIGRDHTKAELDSARSTELLTVVLVVGLLVVIYRAPLLAAIPLVTVYLTIQVALNVLAILAGKGWFTLFQGIQIYITILAYGGGVDYCLFLSARFREEIDRGASAPEAVERAIAGVGGAIVASAATVMFGIGMMFFARFGKFREAGLAIPLALFLVLAATLTFAAPLLRLAGRWAFWPRHLGGPGVAPPTDKPEPAWRNWLFRARGPGTALDRALGVLHEWPGVVWLVTAAALAPFALYAGLNYNKVSYDLIGDLPADAPSVAGTRVLREHFPAGMIGPLTVLLIDQDLDFGKKQGEAVVKAVTDRLRERRGELGLYDVRSLTSPLGVTAAATATPDSFGASEEERREAERELAVNRYTTDLGGRAKVGTRLELVLVRSPFDRASIAALGRVEGAVRDALPEGVRERGRLWFVGTTPSIRDLAEVTQSDRVRIEVLVLAAVFVVLILLLRQSVVPLYLLLSVLFSYYATLGVSFVVFGLLDPAGFTGIDWKVAVFLFTILIAVGEDYNIFLMARVHEEQRLHGAVGGITEALRRTGPIISSCGVIMAGTFASLMSGSLTEMKQLGFALAFGVLLDTFVVRPVLVPAFLILLSEGRLSPARWFGRAPRSAP